MLFGDILNLEKTLGFINMEIDCVTNTNNTDLVAEEGEISDSASVEEISEEAFSTTSVISPNLQEKSNLVVSDKTNAAAAAAAAKNTNNNINNNVGRVWTMNDVYKYRISSTTSYSGLYNLAWAQAVNNKPLDEVFVMMEDDSSKGKESVEDVEGKVIIDVEDDGEKEEGEIEEGEIDLDEDSGTKNEGMDVEVVDESNVVSEREKRVESIKRELMSLNVVDGNKSFDGICSSLKDLADRLMKLVSEVSLEDKESLVELLFSVILNANNVYLAMDLRVKDLNKDVLTRLLTHVQSLNPPLFSSHQLKEMEAIMSSLSAMAYSLSNKDDTKTKQVDCGFSYSDSLMFEDANKDSSFPKKYEIETPPTGLVNHKQKGMALPLLDLHKDHDVDSLPSPTREPSVPLPFDKGYSFSQGSLKPEWPKTRRTTGSTVMHPYETEAVKAISSYQQKFSRSSIYMKDELPSPTPSEEVETGDCEMSDEVSSSTIQKISLAVNSPSLEQPVVSSVNTSISQRNMDPRLGYTASNNANLLPRSSSVRSRDPRLRLNQGLPIVENREPIVNSRKQKTSDELVSEGPMLKRQRSDSAVVNVTGGWLDDKGKVGDVSRSLVNSVTMPILTKHGNDKCANLPVSIPNTNLPTSSVISTPLVSSQATALPVKDMTATTSLGSLLRGMAVNPSLLRGMAVNPSILMNMLKMENQSAPDYDKCAIEIPASNPINRTPPGSSVPGHVSGGAIQAPSSAIPMEESGKVRMKPRDPRRILHNNASKISWTAGADQPKVNSSLTSATSSNSGTSTQNDLQDKLATSSTTNPPDITKEFTNNLKNIADILSVTQASTSPPVIPQIPSSHPVSESGNLRKLVPEKVNVFPPRPLKANAWSDVEHLFDGFDDTQKAAIQKERTRRLDEQKKLFAVRKLCLVLDLDHTLLNSAKFVEVEPLHEDLLRKKEEQDRDKPYRHLFRFPHMGMWTKLRPGIWNFLEKASKLFELHLYTMGNKSYATEMAKLLDPKGELFSGRVVSRGDDGEPFDGDDNVPKTKDLEGVLGMESSVIIIDDSVRVWPHNKPNLIAVERYIYFPCSRRQFGLPGPSLLEIDHDERPEEGTLAAALAVIERIHENFFAQESLDEADVRNILASEQQKILGGCRIVFSRVFPVGEAKPHMHPLWQTAEQFGAVCTNQLDDRVTHVVANSLGTDKVNWALSNGKFVVHPGWVEASALLYRRANEHDFAIKQ